jgi:multicomponent Na+:H+ antiporter subunit G
MEILGALVSLCGAVIFLLAGLGMVRMPDVYNRMQAGTKATTLGSVLFILGIGLARPEWLPRLLLLVLFLFLTNPVSSHALARAAHKIGIPLAPRSVQDTLADAEAKSQQRKDP